MNGPLPFSYSDIEAYCRLKGIETVRERERLLIHIDALDRSYLSDFYDGQEEKSRKSNGKNIPPPSQSPPRHGRSIRPARKTF